MKETLVSELQVNFVAALQAVYEAETAIIYRNVRQTMIALDKAQTVLADARKKFPAQIPER